ncbi:MAG TPA: hypothetical protein VNJ07_05105 [Chitinophagales bacterium]|nr:hypothetical protein [Chitinophagales bacterium]
MERAPLFGNLGKHQLKITTSSDSAQLYFNQGLILSHGFNHAEAARSFRYAAHLDPECAMCYWGVALVLGPNINVPVMDTASVPEAFEASRRAQELSSKVSEWEKALIDALVQRYTDDKAASRAPLDSAYAAAMREVYNRFPGNADIAALFAESLMDLHPWDYWYKDGTPKPWTPEILNVLQQALATDSLNPGANHFYIHATEASQTPELALPSADRLMTLSPAAGHLVHMASHTYMRTGHYHKATLSNQLGTAADSLYLASTNAQGVYPLVYVPHNHHFLASAAGMEGNSKTAIAAAFSTMKHTDIGSVQMPGLETMQQFLAVPYSVLVKFAKWEDILNLPAPKEELLFPAAFWHYARGMAYADKNQLPEAEKELEAVKAAENDSTLIKMIFWSYNSASTVTKIARCVLEARIAERKGDFDKAISLLQEGVATEDSLLYTEPSDWIYPVRHELGAAMLAAGKFADAEKVYNADLKILPENGWSLNGLHEALLKQKKNKEAEDVKARFDKAWQQADIMLKDSRATVDITATAQR